MSLNIEQLEQRLRRHPKPRQDHGPAKRQAAVALPLLEGRRGPELAMIQRARRVGDPWSGHMGFPGGRRDAGDASELACAIRETREEIGVDLEACAKLLCELSDVDTGWRKDRPELLVSPFVFRLAVLPELTLNHEVDAVVQIPLAFFLDKGNRVPHHWEWRGTRLSSDSYLYRGHRIWGLSLRMIDELLEAAQR
ncbi:nudix hydrolase [Luminiphilus syltensis NOR5-1B]|uniref:Nudix hydrolase n=1 Tax=Luminiphilus syltensis NOR5-1B TaxID=565045 RepID=B8KW13_9GAMM|nr:CoA pyrophosphatase [Luminiphilus syltensis]EED34336.1 nudix hydrolase [Luminiphilus syltensis NOR5-1B]